MKQFLKIIATLLCFLLFTACSGQPQQFGAQNSQSGAEEVSGNAAAMEKSLAQLASAKQNNPDTVAWLRIPGTAIDNPVMQSTNNEEYLRKNEKGESDVWGCYFADYYSVLTDRESLRQNTVIYGHSDSTEDPEGKRFTQLFNFLDKKFVEKNPYIYLTLGQETLVYQVFAVFFTDTEFYYIDPQPSDQGFDEFAQTIADKNEFVFENNKIANTDKLLTLSACAYRYDKEKAGDQRLVVMAKLLPAGSAEGKIQVEQVRSPQRP